MEESEFASTVNYDRLSPSFISNEQMFGHDLPINLKQNNKQIEIHRNNDLGISHFIRNEIHNGKLTKVYECGTCEKKFGHQYILMRHLPIHTDERKFECTFCGKAFRQMSTLSQHRAIHSSDRPYVCEVCSKTFNRISTLISHRKTHAGIKPYKCQLCYKAFHQKGNLRNHVFTHTNERPYKCGYCGKGFNQTSNLMCHKVKIHHEVVTPHFDCQTCGKQYVRRIDLRNHEQNEHVPNNPVAPNYNNVIFVDSIKTKAMQRALETNQVPFALFRPLIGVPVIIKVLPATNNKHNILVPATSDDLKKYSQISVTDEKLEDGTGDDIQNKAVGSTVQIKIPVVATIIQQKGEDSEMKMSIVSNNNDTEIV